MNKATNYDYKEAKNKNLDASARLHYLENARHNVDSRAAVKMMGKSPMKQNADFKYMPIIDREKDAMKKGDKSPYKAYGKHKK